MTEPDADYLAFEDDLIRSRGLDPEKLSREIGDGDEMFHKAILPGFGGNFGRARFRYVESALRTFEVYRQLAGFLGGFAALGPVLDFGSGYGRLTRTLLPFLPREKIWTADLYADAIKWQVETFGVNGLISATRPDRFALPQAHSIVFAASVFSHLNDALFRGWLERVLRLTAPHGLLAFSVHSEDLAPEGQALSPSGISFAAWSESGSHDAEMYGMSYVTEAYVARAIEACGGGAFRYRLYPKGLFENQDLYVVARSELDLSALDLGIVPHCGVTTFVAGAGPFNGWAIDFNLGAQIVRADLYVDGALADTMTPVADNEKVLKYYPGAANTPVSWAFTLPALDGDSRRVKVVVTSSSGAQGYCYAAERPSETGPSLQLV